jgi:hypothetical protein
MKTIKILTLEWRKSKTGSDFASINYNRQTRKGLSLWAKKEEIEKHGLLGQEKEITVDIQERGGYENIVAIQGDDGRMYRWDRFGNVSVEDEQPAVEEIPAVQVEEKVPVAEGFKEAIEESGESFVKQLGELLMEVGRATDEAGLTDVELKLSALNVKIAQHHAKNNHEANELELAYKKKRHEKILELKKMNGDMSDTKAKTMAEAELWEEKAELIVAQDKVRSNEIITSGITNLLFAIKDKIKSLRS